MLSKVEEQWIVKSADDYPANVSDKQLLLNLTEIKILRIKSNQQPQHRNSNPLGEEVKKDCKLQFLTNQKRSKKILFLRRNSMKKTNFYEIR